MQKEHSQGGETVELLVLEIPEKALCRGGRSFWVSGPTGGLPPAVAYVAGCGVIDWAVWRFRVPGSSHSLCFV